MASSVYSLYVTTGDDPAIVRGYAGVDIQAVPFAPHQDRVTNRINAAWPAPETGTRVHVSPYALAFAVPRWRARWSYGTRALGTGPGPADPYQACPMVRRARPTRGEKNALAAFAISNLSMAQRLRLTSLHPLSGCNGYDQLFSEP